MQLLSEEFWTNNFCSVWVTDFVYNIGCRFDCAAYFDIMHDVFLYFNDVWFKKKGKLILFHLSSLVDSESNESSLASA